MKQLVLLLAKYTGFFALSRYLTRGDIRMLAYHGIWMGEGHYGNYLYMSPEKFAKRLKLIESFGMPVLSLNDALNRRASESLPPCPVVITIDDGWFGTFRHMMPELEARAFPATLYVTSYYCEHQAPVFSVLLEYMVAKSKDQTVCLRDLGVSAAAQNDADCLLPLADAKQAIADHAADLATEVERQQFASELARTLGVDYQALVDGRVFHLISMTELDELCDRGLDVQLHTHRHRVYSDGKICLAEELRDNKQTLEKVVRTELVHFCYPSGVYEESFWPILQEQGVASATTTNTGLVRSTSNVYALPRILDGELVSDLEFEAELVGFMEIKRRITGKFGRSRLSYSH